MKIMSRDGKNQEGNGFIFGSATIVITGCTLELKVNMSLRVQ